MDGVTKFTTLYHVDSLTRTFIPHTCKRIRHTLVDRGRQRTDSFFFRNTFGIWAPFLDTIHWSFCTKNAKFTRSRVRGLHSIKQSQAKAALPLWWASALPSIGRSFPSYYRAFSSPSGFCNCATGVIMATALPSLPVWINRDSSAVNFAGPSPHPPPDHHENGVVPTATRGAVSWHDFCLVRQNCNLLICFFFCLLICFVVVF